MKAVLDANGLLAIPTEIQAADHLAPGDAFEVERVAPGRYVFAKQPSTAERFTIETGQDGLPVIRTTNSVITSKLVKDIEAQTS